MRAAPAPAGRLAAAVAVSLGLHAGLITALQVLPRGGEGAGRGLDADMGGGLRVRVVALPATPVAALPPVPAIPPVAPRIPALVPEARAATEVRTPGGGVLPSQRYYTATELDERPQPLGSIEPEFPSLALAPVGRVQLALYIGASGDLDRLVVEEADHTGAFEEAARKAFGGARFRPGIRNGVAVPSLMRIEVRFGQPPVHNPYAQDSVRREPFVPKVRVRPAR